MYAGVVDVFAFSVEDEYVVNTRNARAPSLIAVHVVCNINHIY